MNNDELKYAIKSGIILHDNLLLECGVELNSDSCDDKKLLARLLAASNLLTTKYYKTNNIEIKNKFIATNKKIYDKLIVSKNLNMICSDIYIVDDLKENYVCIGLKDNPTCSYTFEIKS